MADFIVTADSGCDLSMDYCKSRNIIPISMNYEINGETYTDGMTAKQTAEFYSAMRSGGIAKTTQINTIVFKEFFSKFEGQKIVHISLSSGISGTYDNAVAAVSELGRENEIFVVDSLNASAACGLLSVRAAELRDSGMSAADAAAELTKLRHYVHSIYTTNDLTYLCRGGRVSKVSAKLAGVLGICPILDVAPDGSLRVVEKVRGDKATQKRMIEKVGELVTEPKKQTIFVAHADCMDKAKEYGSELKKKYGFKEVFYTSIGPIIGAHTGPGLVALFFTGVEVKE